MYRIGEFSRIVGVTIKALRYYDDIKLLSPAHVDEDNGYRYYDEANYKKALWIKSMKKYHFTIKEIQDVMPSIKTNDDLADFLSEKQDMIQDQVLSMKQLQKDIAAEVRLLKEADVIMTSQKVELVEITDMLVASVRYKGRYGDVGKYIGQLYKHVGGKALSPPFSLYYDEEYTEENADIEVCLEVKTAINKGGVTSRTLKGGQFVGVVHVGSYDTLSSSYKAAADFLQANKLLSTTPSREIYLKGPGMIFRGNPEKYETKILLPVSRS